MKTKEIYHKENFVIPIISEVKRTSVVKRASVLLNELEHKKFGIYFLSFSISIIPTSIVVSFASSIKSDFLLSLIVILSVSTLVFCIIEVPVKLILLSGFLSFIASIIIVLYSLTAYSDLLRSLI